MVIDYDMIHETLSQDPARLMDFILMVNDGTLAYHFEEAVQVNCKGCDYIVYKEDLDRDDLCGDCAAQCETEDDELS